MGRPCYLWDRNVELKRKIEALETEQQELRASRPKPRVRCRDYTVELKN